MPTPRYWTGIAAALALTACAPSPATLFESAVADVHVLPAPPDASTDLPDAGAPDAGTPDAGAPDLDAGTPDAGLACNGAAVDTAACATCQATSCCVTMSACANDAQCKGLYTCQRACTTTACLTACRNQFPAGLWLASGLIICSSANCSAACAMPARTCGGIGLTTPTCNACVQSKCCAESTACAANDSCDAFIYQCIDHNSCSSTTDACGTACRAKHDAGVGSFDTLRACALTQCPGECAGL